MNLILKIVAVIIALYLTSVVLLYFLQDKFIFRSEKLEDSYKYTFNSKFEEINLKTKDNQIINSLLFKVKNPKGVILYFHGNKGSLKRWGTVVKDFTTYGYDVFIPDYRGYGKSTGKFDEQMMYDDALVCYDYLEDSYNNIISYGRSLGCTFAAKVAANRDIKSLILEAPFCNLMNVVDYHYPLLTFDFLLKYKFNTNSFIDKVKCKTIMFHGSEDRVIPLNSSKILYDNSNKSQTKYIVIEQGTHHNLGQFEIYKSTITNLLNPDN